MNEIKIKIITIGIIALFIGAVIPQSLSSSLTEGMDGYFKLSSSSAPSSQAVIGNTISLTFPFGPPTIEKVKICNEIYYSVSLKDSSAFASFGAPDLPVKIIDVLLPPGGEITHIDASGEKKYLEGEFLISPAAIPVVDSFNYSYEDFFDEAYLETAIYNSTNPFPGMTYSEGSTTTFRGFTIGRIYLYPIQYIPKTGTISYYNTININIETQPGDISENFRGLPNDFSDVKAMVENPSIADQYPVYSGLGGTDNPEYNYIIITSDNLKPYFQPLADYKSQLPNINARIFTVQNITSNPDYWVDGEWGDNNPDNPFVSHAWNDYRITGNYHLFNDIC